MSDAFVGFNPTIASDAWFGSAAVLPTTGASSVIPGALPLAAGLLGIGIKFLGSFTPGTAAGAAATSGALGSAAGASLRDRAPAVGTKAFRCGVAPPRSNGSAFGSTTVSVAGASGSRIAAWRCILVSGGGVNASGVGLTVVVGTGSGFATGAAAATFGASGNAGAGLGFGAASGGGTNGLSTFGGATATTFGSGSGFGSTTSGAGM
jgi:hypothetical protein